MKGIRGTVARRVLAAGLATGLAVTALTACSASSSDESKTTITFSYLWSGAEAKAISKIIKTYNASQSEIVVKGISSPDSQKQLTSMSASQGSFDVSDNFGNGVGSWAAKGIIAPLDSYLKADGVNVGDFVPAAIDQMKYQGKIYSVPIAVHSFQLLYNKKLLSDAGVAVPKTMDDLASAIAKLTKQNADGTITQLGLGDPSVSTTLTTLGYNFGGDWDGSSKPTPTDKGNIEAASWYQNNITKKFGASNIATFNSGLGEYMSAQDPFYQGKTAMVIDGEWRALNIPTVAPSLDWGVTAIPYVSSDRKDTTQLTASTLFIPSNSKHKAQAAKFISYLVSEKGMTKFSLALGNLPSLTSLLDSSAYQSIPQFSAWLTALKSKNVHALSSAPYSAEYSTDLGKAFDDITRDTATPKAALDAVESNSSNYATK
jgi:multiple sugar transport system substrate-binding protein